MSFCYLLMCHTDPQGVLRTVRRIRELSPSADVVVRFGRSVAPDAAPFAEAGARMLVSDIVVEWGVASYVRAMLEALEDVRATSRCDHVAVLSGQDYPVRDLAEWESEFAARRADVLLDPLRDQPQDHTFTWRVIRPPRPLRRDSSALRRGLVRLGSAWPSRSVLLTKPGEPRVWWGRPRRSAVPDSLVMVKASTWTVLTWRAVESVLRQVARPEVRAFFETVRTPDEWFVSSLVCSDPDLRVALGATTAKSFPKDSPNPLWLDSAVLARLRRGSEAPFARKMPPDASPDLIALADEMSRRSGAQVRAEITEPSLGRLQSPERIRATIVPAG